MPSPLTEKTLELNIMAELVYLSRQAGHRPYFIGYSQLEEMKNGLDTHFSTGAKIGFFQFKRALRRSNFFTFYINNNQPHYNQHRTLLTMHSTTNACRYVFPLIGSNADVYNNRSNLLRWTAFIPPDKLGELTPSQKPHRVRMYLNGKWQRYSEFEEGTWTNIFGGLPDDQQSSNVRYSSNELLQALDLPNMRATLINLETINVQEAFQQRSSFCMILD